MSSLTQVLGWTLLHFLWQGALLAALAALVLWAFQGRDSRLRYGIACIGLLLMTAAPPLTFLRLRAMPATIQGPAAVSPAFLQPGPDALPGHGVEPAGPGGLDKVMPQVVVFWGLGCLVMALRLAGGWLWLQWLRRRPETTPASDAQQLLLIRLCQRMAVGGNLRLLLCRAVPGPTVLGWLRPVILIPPAMVLGLRPEDLELVLAHELAHVLRHDYLVNLLQSLAEVLLFFHPAVWWLSRQIRQEREQAADDLAVRLNGNSLEYASALTALQVLAARPDLQRTLPGLALGAQGGSFMTRIQRLISPAAPTLLAPRAGLVAILILGGGYALEAGRQGLATARMEEPPSSRALAVQAANAQPEAASAPQVNATLPVGDPPSRAAAADPVAIRTPEGIPVPKGTVFIRRHDADSADGTAKAGSIDLRADTTSLASLERALARLQVLPANSATGYVDLAAETRADDPAGRWTYKFIGADPVLVANIIHGQAALARMEKKPGQLRILRMNAFTYQGGLLPRGLKVTVWAGGVPADLVLQALNELEAMTPQAGIPQEVAREVRPGMGKGPLVDINLTEADPLEVRAILERSLGGE